jgi:hypothetical protein
MLMSFPPATEMVQFAGFAACGYGFTTGYPQRGGLPHSDIRGSPGARPSPRLFAACHVQKLSSFSCRHARPERGTYVLSDFPFLCFPDRPFESTRINAPKAKCPTLHKRSQPFEMTFRSPATTVCLQTTAARSTLPIYLFKALPDFCHTRSVPVCVTVSGTARKRKPVASTH